MSLQTAHLQQYRTCSYEMYCYRCLWDYITRQRPRWNLEDRKWHQDASRKGNSLQRYVMLLYSRSSHWIDGKHYIEPSLGIQGVTYFCLLMFSYFAWSNYHNLSCIETNKTVRQNRTREATQDMGRQYKTRVFVTCREPLLPCPVYWDDDSACLTQFASGLPNRYWMTSRWRLYIAEQCNQQSPGVNISRVKRQTYHMLG